MPKKKKSEITIRSSAAEYSKLHAETEFEKYRVIQDRLFLSDYDKYVLELEDY